MDGIKWKKWWRHLNGEFFEDRGFHFKHDPDYWYFGIDPRTQVEPISEDDPNYIHVDNLFKNQTDAKRAAKEWCKEQEEELICKMIHLGLYNGSNLTGELDN